MSNVKEAWMNPIVEKLDGEEFTLWPFFVTVIIRTQEEFAHRIFRVATDDTDYAKRDFRVGFGTTTAVTQYGAQMEITAWMAEHNYFPAPGRVGRWHQHDKGLRRVFQRVV